MRLLHAVIVAICAVGFGAMPQTGSGCATHGSNAGNDIGVSTGFGDLTVFGEISVADNLIIPPTQPTTCVTGIGLGSTAQPLPADFEVTAVVLPSLTIR
jgi:hypothetical protein